MSTETDFIRDALKEIREDIKEIRKDVDSLKTHKAKLYGGTIAIVAILQLIGFFLKI